MRQKFEDEGSEVQRGAAGIDRSQGAARAISSFIDPGLSWRDLDWFKTITKMPIVLKGVQCWEDALDTSRSGIEILEEVVTALRERGLFPNPKFEIYVDGGVRRATDVLKAVAMGATAVGVGRPFIYAYSAYGQEGVEAALQILHEEFEMNLRLLGAPTIKDVVPAMVDTTSLKSHIVAVPQDSLYYTNYEILSGARLRETPAKL
ncbi:L-lactate dehydrogenase (cytochrome) [Rhizoctonia solani AG-1 IB]|uniref:L-lactate dehydrogenase (Cytochrome) n=1 Tax=Thanatephorus cucumeris (strain AG1-IB / isolate 7/3/14) TaxID=1108050 RepID=M5BW83_THACB|nr:L-lactate dehydrogenase (cytochrome) [Rhizoctonia solani AG-1 IB]